MICKMASSNLIKAVVETGYMEEFYDNGHYEIFDLTIDQISLEFKQEVFGESSTLEKKDWMTISHSPEFSWLC